MTYLIDTSALVRVLRRQASLVRQEQIERGLIAICDPVVAEVLTIADAKHYQRVEQGLHDAYPWVSMPDDLWGTVNEVRRELAGHSQHHGLSVADLLVVASALRHRLTVLHEDGDYETVSRIVPDLQQERLSAY
ncbi:PIN domain-containing protein [Natronosporangium hydrolyticum]|uniref:Ribonuclease VapC n=1 Tax=Natronosporangium hydrolyticum TaxID=2811111 RepID=A0A895YHB7_9ACTN|nr:PIN domain-containing protein [Natronosporangium hydrolyticum]QSB14783.1 PIN domain-containing protein [Natronosporangium hydrolyticum]